MKKILLWKHFLASSVLFIFCFFAVAQTKNSRVVPVPHIPHSKGNVANSKGIANNIISSNSSSSLSSNTYYVNDGSTAGDHYTSAIGNDATGNGSTSAPFATISKAISVASGGDIIYVDAGTYIESITVDRSLSIRGSNYLTDPNSATRLSESTILPVGSNPDPYSLTAQLMVYFSPSGSNSTFDGFTLNGDNPSLTSGVNVNGADVDAIESLSAYEGLSAVSISNNIIKNTNYAAIDFDNYFNGGTATSDNSIMNNRFINNMGSDFGISVLIYDNCYTSILNNTILSGRIGIQTGNFYSADPSDNHHINNNKIESSRLGVWHNLAYSNAATFEIAGNHITTFAGATNNNGIEISSIQSAVGVTVSTNFVDGANNGINLWNCPTTNTVTINGGTLSNCNVGVFANNYDGYTSNADPSSYIIDGVNIQNALQAAIYVKDNNLNSNGATVSLQIRNNTILSNTATGLKIEGGDASANFTGANPASFTGQSIYIDQVSNGSNSPSTWIDATAVSFDGQTGATATLAQNFAIEDKINHKVDNSILGFVAVKSNNDFVTQNSGSIQRGVNPASNGWIVNVNTGTYNENVTVNKWLTLQGVGNATIIQPTVAGPGISITGTGNNSGQRTIIKSLQVKGALGGGNSGSGILIQNSSVGYITFDNITSVNNSGNGIGIDHTGSLSDLVVQNSTLSNNGNDGFRVPTSLIGLNGLTITNSHLDGNGMGLAPNSGSGIGLDIFTATVAHPDPSVVDPSRLVTNVMIQQSTFNNNLTKGIYAERLDNATLQDVTLSNNGVTGTTSPAGIDINLKFNAFQNINLNNVQSLGNAPNATGIYIKGRNDGGTYGPRPASLTNVNINGGEVTGSKYGIIFENNVSNVNVHTASIHNNSTAGMVNNIDAQPLVNATCNWWGSANGPNAVSNSSGTGNAAIGNITFLPWLISTAPNSCSGGTHVHDITQNTHFITIQPAVNAANPGDVIVVDPGTYNENVTINTSVSLRGANYGVSCSSGRGAESIVSGTTAGNFATFNVKSDNVTINGFTITDASGSYGVSANHVNNLTVSNNIITNIGTSNGSLNHYGVYFEVGSGTPSSNLSIVNNCINNVSGPVTNAGILIGSSSAAQVLSGVNLSQNKIDHIQSTTRGSYGILVNPHTSTSSVSNLIIQNNEISNLNGNWAHGVGLEGNTPGALVTNNAISAFTSAGSDNVGVTLQDNTGASTVQVNQNSFLNAGFAIGNAVSGTVNGTCNWYGTYDGTSVASKIQGPVNYTPWLTNGTDNSTDIGFQPVANSCNGWPSKQICQQNADQQKKDFDAMQKSDKDVFDAGQKSDKDYFNSQPHTPQQKKTFDDQQKADKKSFDDGQQSDKKAFDQQNDADKKACNQLCDQGQVTMCHDGKNECVPQGDVQKHMAEKGNHWMNGPCTTPASTTNTIAEYTESSDKQSLVPQQYSLSNYPNPFAGTSTIKYDLPYDSKVSIKVYDVMGREITTLVNNEDKKAGSYSVEFNGSKFSKGSLYYRIIAKSKDKQFEQTNKMIQLQ